MTELRLLSIEDDSKIAALICRVAKDVGYTACSAHGDALAKKYDEFLPDVIVLDIIMPDMDGIEVLQFLRERYCRAQVILLSGSDGLSRRIIEKMGTALGLPIAASLTKPFRVPTLRKLLEETKNKLADPRFDALEPQSVGC